MVDLDQVLRDPGHPTRLLPAANPLWGAPRIRKLGLTVSQTTVAKRLGRRHGPPAPTWRSFLGNHVSQLASIDFFTVPPATFRVLFVFAPCRGPCRAVLTALIVGGSLLTDFATDPDRFLSSFVS